VEGAVGLKDDSRRVRIDEAHAVVGLVDSNQRASNYLALA
jgi:hypothetical protein